MRGGRHRRLDEALERGIGVLVGLASLVAIVFFGGVRATELAWVTGLMGGAALIWIVRLWADGSHRLLRHPVLGLVLGFVAYAAWRATAAPVPYVAWQEVWLVGLYALAMMLALQNLHGQDMLQRTAWAASGVGALLGIYALGQFLGESDAVLWLSRPAQYVKRAGATFVNPNHFASMMVLLMPLSLGQAFLARSKPVVRVVHGYAALMMLGGLAVSMSRGGWLAGGLTVAGFFGWIAGRRQQLRVPAAILMGVLATGAVAFMLFNAKARLRIDGIGAQGVPDSGNRLPLWRPALAMWRDHPWTGVGPGHYDVRYPQYRDVAMQMTPGHAHNEYLNTLADYGLAGLALAMGAMLAMGASVGFSRKYVERGTGDLGDKGSNRAAFFVGSTLGLAGLAVHSVGEFPMHVPGIGLVAMVLAGQLASLARFASDRWWFTPGLLTRLAVSAALALAMAWLLPTAWHRLREARLLAAAHRIDHVNADLVGLLRAAHELSPGNPRTAFELGDNLRRASLLAGAEWSGKTDEAIEWLGKAALLNPHDPDPHLSMAEAWFWKGDLDKALQASAKAIQIAPGLIAAADLHGTILFRRGDYAGARAQFQRSIEWSPWTSHYAKAYLAACEKALARATKPGTP